MKSKAFTLAEIMIVLGVIGVLTAILLPVALQSTPNENVMKFKKGHNALLSTVRELVNSDEYYLDGDLGKKPDGSDVDDTKYLCNTISEILNTKEVDCPDVPLTEDMGAVSEDWYYNGVNSTPIKQLLDEYCIVREKDVLNKIVTSDGIIFYETGPGYPFGAKLSYDFVYNIQTSIFYSVWDRKACEDENYYSGFYYLYKGFCMDIDGIGEGENPFGYGIRVDGKVIFGARADEWLQKSIQEKE